MELNITVETTLFDISLIKSVLNIFKGKFFLGFRSMCVEISTDAICG